MPLQCVENSGRDCAETPAKRKSQKQNTTRVKTKTPQKSKASKLGSREIEEGAGHLLEIRRLIREHNKTEKQVPLREPDLLIVMTGSRMAYTRNDGVKVIPLACMKD